MGELEALHRSLQQEVEAVVALSDVGVLSTKAGRVAFQSLLKLKAPKLIGLQ